LRISELNIATPSTSHPQNKTPLGPGDRSGCSMGF
jgi:hypothetical protein